MPIAPLLHTAKSSSDQYRGTGTMVRLDTDDLIRLTGATAADIRVE